MIGTILNSRYELIEKIGEGGMAKVYKAKDNLLNRFVAVKILKKEFSDDSDFVDKFKREAAAAASLSDNNIVNIYDVGSEGSINYIVMEYIKGKTLKQIVNENGSLEPARVIDIAIQIGRALDCAHRNNIIHRDIKPHNIVVTDEGVVKVTDFGIAKVSNSVTITNTSKIMGSAHYFSPEQARGGFVDNRSDLYSLGIVMYEMAAGKVPYDAESPVSVALKHIQEQVIPPIKLNSTIPQGLNNIILKSVEKEPIKRYQSAKELIKDLENIKINTGYTIDKTDYDKDATRIMEPIVLDEEEEELEEENKNLSGKKKSIILFSLLAVLVIGLGFLGGYLWFNKSIGTTPATKNVVIPDIIGKTKEDAEKAIKNKGLVFTVAGHKKSDKPAGTVLECDPEVGKSVATGSEVRVIVSRVDDTSQTMPDLTDMDYDTAASEISRLGLKLGKKLTKNSDTVGKGLVMEQDPAADTDVDENTVVNLTISDGPEIKMVTIPDLSNSKLKDAETLLTSLKLKFKEVKGNTAKDANSNGLVYAQDPAKGSSVQENTVVTLTYYGDYVAPVVKTITIPKFEGTYGAAKASIKGLSDQGIIITIIYKDKTGAGIKNLPPSTNTDTWTIMEQDKVGDAKAGDTLTLTIQEPQ